MKALQGSFYLVEAYIPMERKWRQPVHECNTNTVHTHTHTPPPSFNFLSPLPARLQMANAIFDVFFLHIKPEVTAALFPNQPQMSRHSYLTTGADGTLSEAGSETSDIARNYSGSPKRATEIREAE